MLSSGVGGGGDATRQRTETVSQPKEPVMKRSQPKRQSQIPEKSSTEAKNLDDDEQKIYENLTKLNKVTKTC